MNITRELTPADLQSLTRILDAAARGAGLQIVPNVAAISAKLEARGRRRARGSSHPRRAGRGAPRRGRRLALPRVSSQAVWFARAPGIQGQLRPMRKGPLPVTEAALSCEMSRPDQAEELASRV
ncbi:MAG TPA: hypothetical protein VGB15_11805 [Longimicrobium sp.]|jgi:hypothetical protein